MIRTVALGLLGLVAAVLVGLGIHLVTRDTIALPVVRLEQGATLAPRTVSTQTATEPATTSGSTTTTIDPATTDDRAGEIEEDNSGSDSSGSGRGRGRGRGGDDD